MTSPEEIRMSSNDFVIKNGGWHFSFMGGLDKIVYKINSFGHQELNTSEINKTKHIKLYIDNCLDIFERPIKLRILNNINILPKTIVKNKHLYAKYFKRQIKYSQNTINLQKEVMKKIIQNYNLELDYENKILKLRNVNKKYEDSKLFKIYFFIKRVLNLKKYIPQIPFKYIQQS